MPHDDASGEALRAYHETGESFEVVEPNDVAESGQYYAELRKD